MTKHTYIIVRHGISLANQSKTIVSDVKNGVLPKYGLTGEGKAQAVKSAEVLRAKLLSQSGDARPIYVVSSPFSRAVQTASIFLETLGKEGAPSSASVEAAKGTALSSSASATASVSSTASDKQLATAAGHSPAPSLRARILNKDLKPDIAYQLCERNFGTFELEADTNYPKVWEEDAKSEHTNTRGVEPLASVWARISTMLSHLERALEVPSVVLLVSHGDTLQITQTAFSGQSLTTHRSLQHLNQAEWRVLPSTPFVKKGESVLAAKPVISKL